MFEAILLTHTAATLYMVGLIWMVQRVHYPLFDGVGEERFAAYEGRHTRAITPIVLPVMVVELASAIGLVFVKPAVASGLALPRWMPWTGVGLVLFVWAVTFCLSVPQHVKLAKGFDRKAHRLLVGTNWMRTAGWSLRGGLAVWMLALVMRG
ncbi:MAG: hypothetical protein AAGA25_08985 [Planctomycetota bacterium]